MRQSHKTLLLWGVLIAMFVLIFQVATSNREDKQKVGFSDFLDKVEAGKVTSQVTIVNRNEFKWTDGKQEKYSIGVWDDETRELLRAKNVRFEHEKSEPGGWLLLLPWLPLVLVFVFLFFVMRQLQAGGGKAMSFGKSKARLVSDAAGKVTFRDVAGVEEAKEELSEIIDFLKDPKKYTRLGGRIPKGVLLMGPPGTGKTLLAKAIAGEAGVPFFSISGSDFVEMFVGVGASRVRDLFEQSKKHAPCIIFIDEIDAVGRHRGAGIGGGHDEREQTLNQLLVEMDGFESNEGVILVAATNRPDVLDPALLRPGRFDRRVTVNLPDVQGRAAIFKVHTKKVPLAEDVNLEVLARGTPGFAGAEIANLVNEAALHAAKATKTKVEQDDLEAAKDKVLMGAERKSMVMGEAELRNTAYHESGHTLIAAKVMHADPVHKVTIIPRGRALGLTQMLPEDDRHSITKSYALDQICIMFGGRIAEEIKFNELSTGAGNDLQRATEMARRMVCEWGMSEALGPMTFGTKEESVFIGREISRHQDFSSHTAKLIDAEVRKIMDGEYKRARSILEDNLDVLERLSVTLLEYETLDAKEVRAVVADQPLEREPPRVRLTTREELERRRQKAADSAQDGNPDEEGEKDTDASGPLLGPLVGST